jgi:hypothetical protein
MKKIKIKKFKFENIHNKKNNLIIQNDYDSMFIN